VRNLNYQLKELVKRNRDGSYSTQSKRGFLLSQIANQLQHLGYRRMSATSLKRKHIQALVDHWLRQGLATGTIKNRMAALRWWAQKVNKHSVIAKDNDYYGIERRRFVCESSKARDINSEQLARVTDSRTRLSLRLQREFGLRREESIKFIVRYAHRGDHLALKPSWTKGSKARCIPINTDAQRQLLDEIAEFAGGGSLIPADRSFIQQQRVYVRQVMNAGLSCMHGLRHQYAQRRYQELTGFACPVAGGPARSALSYAQRHLDQQARAVISRELGHEREQITVAYLGR
jgi:site-specific recombinase XerC